MAERVRNVLLVIVDALRFDRLRPEVMPAVAELREEARSFARTFACSNATDASVTTMLSGQYPTRHGVVGQGSGVTDEERRRVHAAPSLAEKLQPTHRTVCCDILERWHERGFDEYVNPQFRQYPWHLRAAHRAVSHLPQEVRTRFVEWNSEREHERRKDSASPEPFVRAESVTEAAVDAVDLAGDEPWFLVVHYWDAHAPYVPLRRHPDRISERTYEGDDVPLEEAMEPVEGSEWAAFLREAFLGRAETLGDVRRKYDAGLWHVDRAVDGLLDHLAAAGELDETAVVLTGDHGESLGERDVFFDHHGLHDEVLHVPLLLRAPGVEPGTEAGFVQHFDLAPTVLDLLDVDYVPAEFDGASLVGPAFPGTDRDAVFAEQGRITRKQAARTGDHKLVRTLDEDPRCSYCDLVHEPRRALYPVDDGTEREERTERPAVVADLERRLDAWTSSLPAGGSRADLPEVDEAVVERLERMGYR